MKSIYKRNSYFFRPEVSPVRLFNLGVFGFKAFQDAGCRGPVRPVLEIHWIRLRLQPHRRHRSPDTSGRLSRCRVRPKSCLSRGLFFSKS